MAPANGNAVAAAAANRRAFDNRVTSVLPAAISLLRSRRPNHGQIGSRASGQPQRYLTCKSTNHFLSFNEHLPVLGFAAIVDWGSVHCAAPPQWLFCAAENLQVAVEVQLPRADGLIHVAADGVHFACTPVDIHHNVAMDAPHRARVGPAGKFRPDALAHRGIVRIAERGFALMADQVAGARPGCDRTGPVQPVVGFPFSSSTLAANAS